MDKEPKPVVSGRTDAAKPLRSLRILVADDDRDTVVTLMMVLRHEGHETRGIHKGAEVPRLVSEFAPDTVILDIHMPDVSGYDVARSMTDRRPRPLLIGISGVYRKAADMLMAKAIGFDHYLTKPYEPSDVLKLLAPLRVQEPR